MSKKFLFGALVALFAMTSCSDNNQQQASKELSFDEVLTSRCSISQSLSSLIILGDAFDGHYSMISLGGVITGLPFLSRRGVRPPAYPSCTNI